MKRLAFAAPAVVIGAMLALFAGWSLRRTPQVTPVALVGKPVPPLVLPTLGEGPPRALRPLVRGPVLVNFYASWCVPCAQEAPALMALRAEGVPIVGVAYKDAAPAARAFLARWGDPYRIVLVDADGRAGVEFGVTGVPETYAVDARGVIRSKAARPITPGEAEALIAAAGG